MIRTRVGYAGGTHKDPTYHDIGDHSESIQIDYDPTKVTYSQLLEVFWSTHNACRAAYSRQYASMILCANNEQKTLALESKLRHTKSLMIQTEIKMLDHFYIAEDYHQKYILRQSDRLMREFQAMYPKDANFVNSTAAARLNCFLAGSGSAELLKKEIDSYGLSPDTAKLLLRSVRSEAAATK